jgi:hypothetical protein
MVENFNGKPLVRQRPLTHQNTEYFSTCQDTRPGVLGINNQLGSPQDLMHYNQYLPISPIKPFDPHDSQDQSDFGHYPSTIPCFHDITRPFGYSMGADLRYSNINMNTINNSNVNNSTC